MIAGLAPGRHSSTTCSSSPSPSRMTIPLSGTQAAQRQRPVACSSTARLTSSGGSHCRPSGSHHPLIVMAGSPAARRFGPSHSGRQIEPRADKLPAGWAPFRVRTEWRYWCHGDGGHPLSSMGLILSGGWFIFMGGAGLVADRLTHGRNGLPSEGMRRFFGGTLPLDSFYRAFSGPFCAALICFGIALAVWGAVR
jgi:hypothetical protein